MNKKIICLDFVGVLHSYTSGWLPDGLVPGAMAFLRRLVEDGRFDVCVVSDRCSEWIGMVAIRRWLAKHIMGSAPTRIEGDFVVSDDDDFDGRAIFEAIRVVDQKPTAHVSIDDRAITFDLTWPDLDELAAFVPWNKRTGAKSRLPYTDRWLQICADLMSQFFIRNRDPDGNGDLPETPFTTPMPPVKPPRQSDDRLVILP